MVAVALIRLAWRLPKVDSYQTAAVDYEVDDFVAGDHFVVDIVDFVEVFVADVVCLADGIEDSENLVAYIVDFVYQSDDDVAEYEVAGIVDSEGVFVADDEVVYIVGFDRFADDDVDLVVCTVDFGVDCKDDLVEWADMADWLGSVVSNADLAVVA